jgi:hypothetical protein
MNAFQGTGLQGRTYTYAQCPTSTEIARDDYVAARLLRVGTGAGPAAAENGRVPLYRDEAVVLRTQKLGEADRIVTILTRRTGRVRAAAKGVRKTKSRFGARLGPARASAPGSSRSRRSTCNCTAPTSRAGARSTP